MGEADRLGWPRQYPLLEPKHKSGSVNAVIKGGLIGRLGRV
jgi:hypothetical protein